MMTHALTLVVCSETKRNSWSRVGQMALFPSSSIRWKCVPQQCHWWHSGCCLWGQGWQICLEGSLGSVWRWERRQDMDWVQLCPCLVPYSPLWVQEELSPNKYKGGCAWVSENAITWCGIPMVRCWLISLCMESYFAALETAFSWGRHGSTCMECFSKEGFFP